MTMPEVMQSYGIKIRNNMCSCPFHGNDRHPSMKVFKTGANCFTCGWNGDIFSFVMQMDGVDFKTAFKKLGGSYAMYNNEKEHRQANIRLQSQKAKIEQKKRYDESLKNELSKAIQICRRAAEIYEPFSDGWTYAKNKLQYLLYMWEQKYVEQQEIDDFNVYRECRQVKQRFL